LQDEICLPGPWRLAENWCANEDCELPEHGFLDAPLASLVYCIQTDARKKRQPELFPSPAHRGSGSLHANYEFQSVRGK
jgi:hypothetical protein